MLDKLRGYKTYIVAGAGALMWFCNTMGWLPDETFNQLLVLVGLGGAVTLRAGIKKAE